MKKKKGADWIFPAVLMIFCIDILLLPVCIKYAYAGSGKEPASVLSYTRGKLTWDSEVSILPDGTAEIDFFLDEYNNIKSWNKEDVIAPGEERTRIIRLKNDVAKPVSYKAVLYDLKDEETIPLKGILTSENSVSIGEEEYPALPQGVGKDDVLEALKGEIDGRQIEDFTAGWKWVYEESIEQDADDTALGQKGEPDTLKLGFYLVVEDNNSYHSPKDDDDPEAPPEIIVVEPQPPDTGFSQPVAAYITLLVISGTAMCLLFITRKKDRDDKNADA